MRPQETVLRNKDLVHNILEYLAVDPRSDWNTFDQYHKEVVKSRKGLYNAALVFRGFRQPALDLLWRTMDSVRPLIRLLPETLLSEDDDECTVLHMRSEQGHDLRSFNFYAAKIEAFCLLPSTTLKWPVYYALTHQDGIPLPLLPRLHTLHIENLTAAAEDPLLFHILSPSLRQVMISTYSGADVIRTFLTCLLKQAPGLQYFRSHARLPRNAVEWVMDFDQLQKLRLNIPYQFVFRPDSKLNRLQRLTHLYMDFGHVSDVEMAVILNGTIPCATLTHLSITCKPLTVFKLLEALEFPRLRELNLTLSFHKYINPTDNLSIFASLKPWAGTLEVLTINGDKVTSFKAIYQPSPKTEIVEFQRLRYVKVENLYPERESLDLSNLARFIPHIEILSFTPQNQIITYNTLCAFLLRCRKLRYLQVGFNGQTFPKEQMRRSAFPCRPLKDLSVGASDKGDFDPFMVAHHLLRLFPRIETIAASSERWNSVRKIVDCIRSLEMDKSEYPDA